MKLGIIQGRLSPPVNGHIQEFPNEWEKEFSLLDELELNHIEWIITNESFRSGILKEKINWGYKISSICADNLINEKITEESFLFEQLTPICDFAVKNNIKSITIPLLEKSEINYGNLIEFSDLFKYYGKKYSDLEFRFESEATHKIMIEFVNMCDNFFITYDTGNITSAGHNHYEYISVLCPFIKDVHLKDRTINPVKTVEPTHGNTDFGLIFKTLGYFNYNNTFTIQTARGEDNKEIETIKKHSKLFKDLYYEKFI